MNQRSHLVPIPASREPLSLLTVDRAVSEMRRGRPVLLLAGGGEAALIEAAEATTPDSLARLRAFAGTEPRVALTARRAVALGLPVGGLRVVIVSMADGLTAETVRDLADPLFPVAMLPPTLRATEAPAFGCDSAAVKLAKTARLLPTVVTAMAADGEIGDAAAWAARHDLLLVDAGDVFQYEHIAARSLRAVSEAKVPLADAETARLVAFRPLDGGVEHIAIIVGEPSSDVPVLTRVHSECFTGDLLGSLRCDCGDQLRGAIRTITGQGGGVLLYLAQEGRGIGLVNKLRAYRLQDEGHDTLDANEHLGFDADERIYLPAAMMLRQLGFTRIRLLTNNPDKVEGLGRYGIAVVERLPLSFAPNPHNQGYVRTKRERGGHWS